MKMLFCIFKSTLHRNILTSKSNVKHAKKMCKIFWLTHHTENESKENDRERPREKKYRKSYDLSQQQTFL